MKQSTIHTLQLICTASCIHLMVMLALPAAAQNSYDSSFRFYYYNQKLGMFEQMADQEDEVVWMGDSITDGCEWSGLIPHLTTLNRGISSDNTFGVLHRLGEVTRRKPKKLFLLIGINDIARDIPVAVILRNYSKIVQQVKAKSPSTAVYIQTLLPTNSAFTNFPKHQNKTDKVLSVNAGLQQLAKQENTRIIGLYTAFQDNAGQLDKQNTNDGLHLTGAGYLHWREVLIKYKALE